MSDHSSIDNRPSPDDLLISAKRELAISGNLKIFLGAAPGVGKTYTMLEAAREQASAGTNVVVGVIETHGRLETAEMLLGLEIVPQRIIEYRGSHLKELDVDALLKRQPQLVLIDELAHTNIPGSRHTKRYLDVEEILKAGIDVYTAVNIQHLESLKDAVAQITGITVRETIPDSLLESAEEVELVDLPVEDLLDRLREGKVYVPEQAGHAIRNYFRPGNLNALRQLALRHTAERVDRQMSSYMRAHAIRGPWSVTERLLVSIGPSPLSERLVRSTHRRAKRRQAHWAAVYVETPRHYQLSETDQNQISRTLRLAQELGGDAITIPGNDIASELLRYASLQNVTEIVVGKSRRSRVFELWHGSIVKELLKARESVDIHIISADQEDETGRSMSAPLHRESEKTYSPFLIALIAIATSGICAQVLRSYLSLPNLSLVFLLGVLGAAVFSGLRASIVASLASLLVYDFFFVDPLYTFSITSPQDVLSIVAFLVVAILTSNLTGRVRDQAEATRLREQRTFALYSLSRSISAATTIAQLAPVVVGEFQKYLNCDAVLLLPANDSLQQLGPPPASEVSEEDLAAAVWSWRNNKTSGVGTSTLPGGRWLNVPLQTGGRSVGLVALALGPEGRVISPDEYRLIEAMSGQIAIAVERAQFGESLANARVAEERERLYSLLLSSISHDLRTPLVSIMGSVTTLLENSEALPLTSRTELLNGIRDESERLNRFVGNLLNTTRLESGAFTLNRQWVDVSDVIGAALQDSARVLNQHKVSTDIAENLPLLFADFVLVQQALINLLENAARYSDPGATITIRARAERKALILEVEDEGAGVAPADQERIFDKFYRVDHGDRQIAGTGLGLSICRAIMHEHEGEIWVRPGGGMDKGHVGSIFTLSLPIHRQPQISDSEVNLQ